MNDKLGILLEEHEEPCAVIRSRGSYYAARVLLGMVWVLLPFFSFFPLLRFSLVGWVLAGVIALGGVCYLLRLRARWYGNALVFTTERCIDVTRHGFGAATITAVAWKEVVDIVNQGSRLRVILKNGPFDMLLPSVRNAEDMRRLGNEVQYLHRRSG